MIYLFFHGLGSDPSEFDHLRAAGLNIVAPIRNDNVSCDEWVNDSLNEYFRLIRRYPGEPIALGGASTGALVALAVASLVDYPIDRPLFLFAPALSLRFGRSLLIRLACLLAPRYRIATARGTVSIQAVRELLRLQRRTMHLFGKHKALVFYASDDDTVSVKAIRRYYRGLGFRNTRHAICRSKPASDLIAGRVLGV